MKNTVLEFIKDHIYVILGGACIVIIGLVYIFLQMGGGAARVIQPDDIVYSPATTNVTTAPVVTEPPTAAPTEAERTIVVHIVGEVLRPGVFELTYGARVNDVLQLAGGETEYADIGRVNLAAFLRDAMQIIIPAIGEDVEEVFVFAEDTPDTGQGQAAQASGLVNINTASLAELQTLPGIGPVLAQNIVDFREAHGGFTSVEELIGVNRIGATTLERLRPLVTV